MKNFIIYQTEKNLINETNISIPYHNGVELLFFNTTILDLADFLMKNIETITTEFDLSKNEINGYFIECGITKLLESNGDFIEYYSKYPELTIQELREKKLKRIL